MTKQSREIDWYKDKRVGGLARFAAAITILNIFGHSYLGFEQAFVHPFVALLSTYFTDFILEILDAKHTGRPYKFSGGWQKMVLFFLPAHISGMAISMLLYPNSRLIVLAFAGSLAMASKHIFRVLINNKERHVFNPSNLGITITLLLFPWVGIAPPYQFTEYLYGVWDWLLPALIIFSGSFLNFKFTNRLPLVLTWIGTFFCQAIFRAWLFDTSAVAALGPMTGLAFLLFTFYMVTDPPTTPSSTRNQVIFGFSVALGYFIFMSFHVVFGLFYSLALVGLIRGFYIASSNYILSKKTGKSILNITDVDVYKNVKAPVYTESGVVSA